MKIGKNLLWLFGIVFLIAIIGFFVFSSGNGNNANSLAGNNSGNVQVVKMWVENGQYKFDGSVKAGIPVRIEADMTRMPGCSKSFSISTLGIRKTFTSSDNSLEFTPDKSGVYNVECSMNMYRGDLVVV